MREQTSRRRFFGKAAQTTAGLALAAVALPTRGAVVGTPGVHTGENFVGKRMVLDGTYVGCTFTGCDLTLRSGVKLIECTFDQCSPLRSAEPKAERVNVIGCTFTIGGGYAIDLQNTSNAVISGNVIRHRAPVEGGITWDSTGLIVRGNTVHAVF